MTVVLWTRERLFRQEFRRGEACDFLEDPVEVMHVFESQQMGRFADIVPMHQEAFPPFNHDERFRKQHHVRSGCF